MAETFPGLAFPHWRLLYRVAHRCTSSRPYHRRLWRYDAILLVNNGLFPVNSSNSSLHMPNEYCAINSYRTFSFFKPGHRHFSTQIYCQVVFQLCPSCNCIGISIKDIVVSVTIAFGWKLKCPPKLATSAPF